MTDGNGADSVTRDDMQRLEDRIDAYHQDVKTVLVSQAKQGADLEHGAAHLLRHDAEILSLQTRASEAERVLVRKLDVCQCDDRMATCAKARREQQRDGIGDKKTNIALWIAGIGGLAGAVAAVVAIIALALGG